MLLTKQSLGAHVMASDDEERFTLTHIQVRPNGAVAATNGHVAVLVEPKAFPDEEAFPAVPGLEGHQPSEPVYLLVETAKAAAANVPKESDLVSLDRARLLVDKRIVIGTTDLRTPQLVMQDQPADVASQFPDVTKPFPSKPPLLTIGLDASYLALIAAYAKKFDLGPNHLVRLTLYGPNEGVRFSWDDERHHVEGMVMPLRI